MVRKVGVMSAGGSFTGDPNTYTTLAEGHGRRTCERTKRDVACLVVAESGVHLLMLWHMRGMSRARNMRDSQCGDSLLVTPHT